MLTHSHACTHMLFMTYINAYMHVYTLCTCTHTYTHTHTHTHTYTVQYSRSVKTQTFVRTFPVTQSCMHTHVCIMHMHVCTHTHIHIHIVQCNRVHTNICNCSGGEKPVLSARTMCGHPTAAFLCCTSPHHLGCAGILLFAFPFLISYRLSVSVCG